MGIMRKVLTGVGCAASVATGVVVGKVVGMKTYEYTGNTAVAGIAGGGAGATIGLAGVGTTLAISQMSHDAACWKNHCNLDDDLKKDESEEIGQLSKLVDDYYSESIKMTHEIDRLQEENQELKERVNRVQAQFDRLRNETLMDAATGKDFRDAVEAAKK